MGWHELIFGELGRAALTLWLGNWQRTEVMLLAYWAMTFRMSFSTLCGMRPATLVMISWSSSSGSEGSLRVFIRVSTHFLSCNPRQAPSSERANSLTAVRILALRILTAGSLKHPAVRMLYLAQWPNACRAPFC